MNKILILVFTMLLASCSFTTLSYNRSGSLHDAYVEEPISEKSKKYKHALTVSNQAMNMFLSKDYVSFYFDLLDEELMNQVEPVKLQVMMYKIEKKYGKLLSFKEMQWWFTKHEEKGEEYLYSIKLAIHERDMLKYVFMFSLDGEYEKLKGFRVIPPEDRTNEGDAGEESPGLRGA